MAQSGKCLPCKHKHNVNIKHQSLIPSAQTEMPGVVEETFNSSIRGRDMKTPEAQWPLVRSSPVENPASKEVDEEGSRMTPGIVLWPHTYMYAHLYMHHVHT